MKLLSTAYSVPLLLSACSGQAIDLGEDNFRPSPPAESLCSESAVLEGSFQVRTQQDLQKLDGCEEIEGDLAIGLREGDLSELHALRSIGGTLGFHVAPLSEEEEIALSKPSRLSLVGLEGLEHLNVLALEDLSVTSLESLSGLRGDVSTVSAVGCRQLTDLTGLENISITFLLLLRDNDTLKSLTNLKLNNDTRLVLDHNPELFSLGLELPLVLTELSLIASGFTNVDEFTPLGSVNELAIVDNNSLENLQGLSLLHSATTMAIVGNPELVGLPSFDELYFLRRLTVQRNEKLETFPPLAGLSSRVIPSYQSGYPLNDAPLGNFRQLEILEVEDNPVLASVIVPDAWHFADYLSIARNTNLTGLHLNKVESVERLAILDNPSLLEVVTDSLATVGSLAVVNNAQLATDTFDPVLTFNRDMSGNASN